MDYRLRIARRYLFSARQISMISFITGISVGGVALGVASLIVVLSVLNGFSEVVRDMLVGLDPHVRIVPASGHGIERPDSLMAVATALPYVEHAASYVQGKALLVYDGSGDVNKVVIVRGVDPETIEGVSPVVDNLSLGTFDLSRRSGRAGIVLGLSLSQRLSLLPGGGGMSSSEVRLLSAPGIERLMSSIFGTPPLTAFDVRGIYELEPSYDESHVFIDIAEAQRLFQMGTEVSGVELRLDNLYRADAVKAQLRTLLDPDRFEVLTWYDLQKSLYDVMELEKWGATAILVLIIVVAAFNLVGSLTMVVIEKRFDIGVLQAMGVSRRNIRRIFIAEGLLIGGIGTGVGLTVGLTLVLLQKHFSLVPLIGAESFILRAYPVSIETMDIAVVVAVAVGLSLLATLYPASRAAAIEPARAVQMET